MPTPHINASKGDFAPIVLMPGDPLRAKYIAYTFLKNVKEITSVRNMLGYTGTYKGKRISIMGHGMGIPSCSIYAIELIKFFDVKKIIRVGSCGGIQDNINIKDVVIAIAASTDSKVNRIRFRNHDLSASADYNLLENAIIVSKKSNIDVKVGNIFTSDSFYNTDTKMMKTLKKYNFLGVEMEAAGLYGLAIEYGIQALCICTVSDHVFKKEEITSEEREKSFNEMCLLALETALQTN